MDKKDEIILQQLEVIRTMTERNLRSMGDDFWGTPFEGVLSPKSPSAPPSGGKPAGSADGKMPAQPSDGKTAGGQPAAKAEKTEVVEPLPKEDMKDLQAELDSYIGLATVKEEVRNLINMASVYKLRRQHDLPTTDMSLHMVFTGNPGTGKTMMARMMARIYRSLDILSKGQLVEVSDGYARNLGLNIKRARLLVIVSAGVLTAIVTAYCGPIIFLGLAVPHLARAMFQTSDHRTLMPATLLLGAALALICNLLGRMPGFEGALPVNSVTALVGAPVVASVLFNKRKNDWNE